MTARVLNAREATAIATAMERHELHQDRYYGDVHIDLGTASAWWDEEEECWAVKVREEDIPFSCGADCCGIDRYAVVAIYEDRIYPAPGLADDPT